jgi:hypothetical protein
VEGPALDRSDPNDVLLRFVDLSSVHIGRARQVTLAEGMRPVLSSTEDEPLIAAGRVDGQGVALLAFALGESDLPLQVAFPLLTSNLVDFLLPPTDGVLPPSVQLGEPLSVQVDPAIRRVSVIGTRTGDAPSSTEDGVELEVVGGRVTIPGQRFVGVLALYAVGEDDAAGGLLGQSAANLFDPGESAVAPGDPVRISDLGRGRPAAAGGDLTARNEWWWPLALAAFVLLLAEWILFHRPTRRAIARLRRRGPRLPAASAGRASERGAR